jgi:DNA-directed RNA polymerase specialized sigma24 family protein
MDNLDSPRPDAALPRDPLLQSELVRPSADTKNLADFNDFYRTFVSTLVAFLVCQGAGLNDAADITQETMTTAYQWWSEIDHPKAWARTAASRKLARQIAGIEKDPIEAPERNSLLPVSIDMGTWEQRHEILTVLTRLSARQRQVMAWTLEGYAPAEIANEPQSSFQTIRTDLTQARRTLAAYLGTTGDEQ